MSSVGAGEAECGVEILGVEAGLGVATAEVEADGGAAPFFIAAIFAAISARFWAMRSAVAYGTRREHEEWSRRVKHLRQGLERQHEVSSEWHKQVIATSQKHCKRRIHLTEECNEWNSLLH